jgi:peroxiredoxin (alkyl hydroperoxide reductase subunit C)
LAWFDAIEKMKDGIKITFPLIDDLNMKIARLYGMIQENASDTHAVRAVFIIDPKTIIRAILFYPATLGRNIEEIKRMLIALQTADKFNIATPANWSVGNDVLVPAPNTATKMRKNKEPWFLTYKKLSKREIYDKIQNKTDHKK